MRVLSASALAAISGQQLTLAQLVLLEFPGLTIALNSSVVDLVWDGVTYKGAAGLGSVGQIDDSPGEVKGLEFTLSGVPAENISLALDDSAIVQGKPTTVRTAILNSAYQVADAPIEFRGRLDTMSIAEDGETCTIRATAESSAVDLLNGTPLTYSDADQKFLYPGDRAFELVTSQANAPVVWPSAAWARAVGPR